MFTKKRIGTLLLSILMVLTFTLPISASTVDTEKAIPTLTRNTQELRTDLELIEFLNENNTSYEEIIQGAQNPDNLEMIVLYENAPLDSFSRSSAVEGIVIFDYVIVDSSNPGFSVIAKVISSKDVDVFGSLELNYHYGIQDKWNFVSGLSILPVRMKGEGIWATWKHVFTWRIPPKYLVEKFSYDMKVKTLSGSVYQAINTGNEQYIRRKFSGGRHGSLDSLGGERHHTPANSTSPLSTNDGPVIQMEYADIEKLQVVEKMMLHIVRDNLSISEKITEISIELLRWT